MKKKTTKKKTANQMLDAFLSRRFPQAPRGNEARLLALRYLIDCWQGSGVHPVPPPKRLMRPNYPEIIVTKDRPSYGPGVIVRTEEGEV